MTDLTLASAPMILFGDVTHPSLDAIYLAGGSLPSPRPLLG
jgi:hypothetical protein